MNQLSDIKCTNCGAELQVDKQITEAHCRFCGSQINIKQSSASSANGAKDSSKFDNFLSLASSFLKNEELESADHYASKALEHDATNPNGWQCRMETQLSIAKKLPLGDRQLESLKSGLSAAETAIKFQGDEPSIKLTLLKYCTYLLENLNKDLDQAILRYSPDISSTSKPYWHATSCFSHIFNSLFLRIEDYYVDDKDIFEYIYLLRQKGQSIVNQLQTYGRKIFREDEYRGAEEFQRLLDRIDTFIITPHSQKYGKLEPLNIPFNIPLDVWKGMTDEERTALLQCSLESTALPEEIPPKNSADSNKELKNSISQANFKDFVIASSGIVFFILSLIIDLISADFLAGKHIVIYFCIHHAIDTFISFADSMARKQKGLWGWTYLLMKPVYFYRRSDRNNALKALSIISMIFTCWYFFSHAIIK